MSVTLAQPRGFCAGVERAIEIVERALERYGAPVYVLHEIVHNRHVVEDLRARGAVFVERIEDIPPGAHAVFSAHGVSRAVVRAAHARKLHSVDATCPLVSKVHGQAQRYARMGYDVVLIGHLGHPEVEGTRGQVDGPVHVIADAHEVAALTVRDPARVAYVTQTTLSLDDTRGVIAALRARFPAVAGPDTADICYATQNRQNAVRALLDDTDVLVVVGAPNSSNSNRLRELGSRTGKPAYLVQDAAELRPEWFTPASRVGLTAGASAPETLVQGVLERLRQWGHADVRVQPGAPEEVRFRLPPQLEIRTRPDPRARRPGA